MPETTVSKQIEKETTWLKLGKITAVFGVKGWLKIYANTDKKENILAYQPWYIERNNTREPVKLRAGKPHGKTIIALLEGIDDRNDAETWVGCEIYATSDQLPVLKQGEFYWSDLIGLQVVALSGENYGVIDHLLETGANDVMVIKGDRERLIPFVMGQVIKSVDLKEQQMIVDWDVDY
ncbi:MAG: ribosome maturation factor RimM [Cycloclasticus sp.]|nr:MAG: ribosome maturation factor RimM [Cycloclasticus sp.]